MGCFDDASIGFWHDRAVFHFLTDAAKPAMLRRRGSAGVQKNFGGYALIATFAPDGPEKCSSGRAAVNLFPEQIAAVLGETFELVDQAHEVHHAVEHPQQAFSYALLRRLG
ncbi:MAG: hypothetical protein R3E66_05815 [bacterium]